jgi:integrase
MSKILTSAAVERYRPARQRREIRDGGCPGLYLIIQPSGHKSWAMRFRRPDSSPAKLTLGSVDLSGKEPKEAPIIGKPLSLASARALAGEMHRQRELGRDVVADRAAAKHRRRTEIEEGAANTFAALARRFIDEHARVKTRRWPETGRLLGLRYPKDGGEPEVIRGGLCDRWADKPVREIDNADIWSAVDETKRLGAPGLERRSDGPTESRARAMLSALSTFFGWLARHRNVENNPCAAIEGPGAPKARDRVLTGGEVVKFWAACDAVGEPFGQLLKLLLLTGARLNEVAGMRRTELSEDGRVWNIPGERTKNHRAHVVPLAPLARDILATVKPIACEAGLMFTTTGRSPVSGWSKIKRRLDASMKCSPWRLHDLRRSFVTGLAELGIRPDVIELAVNHRSGMRGGIAGVYNRSELMDERRAALERWATNLEGLVSGRKANVVDLPGKRRRSK